MVVYFFHFQATSNEATAETWKELGNLYFDTDQAEQTIKAYERSLALRPNDSDTLNDQGAMYRQTGDFGRALANFEKTYFVDPHNLESLYNCGYIYAFDLNNIPKALVMWRLYLDQDSKSEMDTSVIHRAVREITAHNQMNFILFLDAV